MTARRPSQRGRGRVALLQEMPCAASRIRDRRRNEVRPEEGRLRCDLRTRVGLAAEFEDIDIVVVDPPDAHRQTGHQCLPHKLALRRRGWRTGLPCRR